MIQALLYKEWIKSRYSILLSVILFAGFIAYTFVDTAQIFRIEKAESIWNSVILKDAPLIPYIKWLPLLAGVILALAQHVPEMVSKRLKLTLHLPLAESKITAAMLGYGLAVLSLIYILAYLFLFSGLSISFPIEFLTMSFQKSFPWFMGGFSGYTLASWIVYEPVWKYRICYAIITVSVLSLFYLDGKSGAYQLFSPYLVFITILSITFPFYSVSRFKDGAQ